MKKLLTFLATFAMLCSVGCEEQGDDNVNPNDKPNTEQPEEKPDDAYIALNKEVVTFSPDGESVDIKVYSNYTWELTNNCDWVTTSITSGEASDEGVTVTLSADLSYDNREGTIIFSCGKAKKPLVVSQSLKEVLFADENNTFNIPTEGGNVIIAYQTTVECEVVIPEEAQSWISIAPTETRALVSYSTTLNVAENTTYSKRSAIVKVVAVCNKSLVAEYTITQDSKLLIFYIEYTSTNGKVVKPYNTDVFGAHIIRNEYIDGKGYIWFDAPITSIGGNAFRDCSSLASVTIPDSVTSIGKYAFKYCSSLANVTIPDSVTSIGEDAFCNCESLESITIPDSVTSIGWGAFYECKSLESITIPNSVTSIGNSAFYNCSSLAEVYCKPTTPPAGGGHMFYYNVWRRKIYVPTESVEAYKSATYWSEYADSIVGYDFE